MSSIVLALTISAFAQAGDATTSPAAPSIESQVKQLTRQLDDADRDKRNEAESKLLEIGADVLPLLPEINASTAAEVKDRLTRIRRTLEKQAAAQSAKETFVTMKGKKTLQDIFSEFQEQTQNELLGQDVDIGIEVDVDFEKTRFFEALDKILDDANLTVDNFGGETRKMSIVAKNEGLADRVGTAAYAGPFRIEATEIVAQRGLRDTNMQNMRLRLEVLWEPRILPILIRQSYADIELTGDDGNSLSVNGQGNAEIPVQSTVLGVDVLVPLELPERSVGKIASLKGTMYALVPGQHATFKFDKLEGARGVVRKQAGLAVTLDRVKKNRSLYEIRIRLRFDKASESLQSHLDWASDNEIYLESADGNRVDNPNFEKYLERNQEIGYAYLFPLNEDISKYQLFYKSPAAIIEMPIKYELKNISLP